VLPWQVPQEVQVMLDRCWMQQVLEEQMVDQEERHCLMRLEDLSTAGAVAVH